MKTTKHRQYDPSRIHQVIALAGAFVAVVGTASGLYELWNNWRFVRDGADVLYYLRYVLLLGGGFAIAYVARTRTKGTWAQLGVAGTTYGLLASVAYLLLDALRVYIQNIVGEQHYLWSGLAFQLLPLAVLAIVSVLVWVFRGAKTSTLEQKPLTLWYTVLFGLLQLTMLASMPTYGMVKDMMLAINVIMMLLPLVYALAIFVLTTGMQTEHRLFYAAIVGGLYAMLGLVGWGFRVDASAVATDAFAARLFAIASILALGLIAAVWWATRGRSRTSSAKPRRGNHT
jgi:hypothetical protein